MKIGILSDSHGNTVRLQRAVGRLVSGGAEALVHCGDIGSGDCLRALGGQGVPAYAVAGNMDRSLTTLPDIAAGAAVHFEWRSIEVPLGDGRYLAATHGHLESLVVELLAGRQFPYLCLGHSHERRDERVGDVRIINPGAIHRATVPSVALLDSESDELQFIEKF